MIKYLVQGEDARDLGRPPPGFSAVIDRHRIFADATVAPFRLKNAGRDAAMAYPDGPGRPTASWPQVEPSASANINVCSDATKIGTISRPTVTDGGCHRPVS